MCACPLDPTALARTHTVICVIWEHFPTRHHMQRKGGKQSKVARSKPAQYWTCAEQCL